MISHSPISFGTRQRGVALITTLILLVMMTIIAVTAARMAAMEERMAGNTRDRDIALRAAEMGLRDAERYLLNGRIFGCTGFKADCGASTTVTTDDGLCDCPRNSPSTCSKPVWKRLIDNIDIMTVAPSVAYGDLTGATAIPGVSEDDQPRYLIECLKKNADTYYRITVRALGAKPGTAVMLEEMFKP